MDLLRNSGHFQGAEHTEQTKSAANILSSEDLARLNTKREEIIMVLRLWHGYGRSAADRTLSNWLSDRAQGYSGHTRPTPFKPTLKWQMRPEA
ncbi:MAG: hypothetical protein KA765_16345 [Thermoflexales bacterium]|nr:hypothetical protein [Thermoflexales bacterium]